MADTNIPATPADGNIKTVLVPLVDDIDAPTLTEVNTEAALDISCYLTAGGFAFSVDQATITDERECDTITRAVPGRSTPNLEITGIDNTNTEYATTANKLADALKEHERWIAVRRRGKAHDAPFEVGDIVTVTDFITGLGIEVAAEANSVLRSVWPTFVQRFSSSATIVAGGAGD